MGCYTEWDAYLEKGSKAYKEKEDELKAKLKAVKHIVDYYYSLKGLVVPHATHSGKSSWIETAENEFSVNSKEVDDLNEVKTIDSITHHVMCDQIHFTTLYDICTLLNLDVPEDARYARVIMKCANIVRAR